MKNNANVVFFVYVFLFISLLLSGGLSYSNSLLKAEYTNEMVLLKRYHYKWLHTTDHQQKDLPVVFQWEYQGDEEQKLESPGYSVSESEVIRVTLPEEAKTAAGYFMFCSEAVDEHKQVGVTLYHSHHPTAQTPEHLYQKDYQKESFAGVNTQKETSGYRHTIHLPHENDDRAGKLDLLLSNAQFSKACSPALFDESGKPVYSPLVIHQFGRSKESSKRQPESIASPSIFAGEPFSPDSNETDSVGGYDLSPPFDGRPGPGGGPVMLYGDFVIEIMPYQADASETRLNETTRSMLYSLGYSENVFTVTVRWGEHTYSRHLPPEEWQALSESGSLNSPALLLSLVAETSNEHFRQRFIELIGYLEQKNSEAIQLWSEEILSLAPEQITIDVWLEKTWQALIAEMKKAAATARTVPNGESGQPSHGGASGETGAPPASSGSQSSGTPTDQNGDGGNSGRSPGGAGRQPSGGGSLPSVQPVLSQSQVKILEQIINLLKSSKDTDVTLLKTNLFFLISKLSPEAINKPVAGTNLLYHLIDSMDERKISLLKEIVVYLLKERNANPFEICDKPDTCNLSLHRATQRGFASIVKLIIDEHPETAQLLDGNGRLPIHYACENGSVDLARLLLPEVTAFYLHPDKNGKSPLLLSIQSGSLELLKLIKERMQGEFRQALIDRVDGIFKAISVVKSKEIIAILEALIKEGLDISVANTAGDTLLHLCVKKKNRVAVQWLIYQGLDITKINSHGETPLFMDLKPSAKKSFDREFFKDIMLMSQTESGQSIQQILQSALSDPDSELFSHVRKIIEECIVKGNADHLRHLTKLGVFNAESFRTEKNKSALKLALEKRQYQVVDLLVKLGANVDAFEGNIRNINYIFDIYHKHFKNAGSQFLEMVFFPTDDLKRHINVIFELFITMFKRTHYLHERKWRSLIEHIKDYEIYETKHYFYNKVGSKIYCANFLKKNRVGERLNNILKEKQELRKQGRKTGILYEKMEETEL